MTLCFIGRTHVCTYTQFVAQETRSIRKLFMFIFFIIKNVEIYNAKVVFLLELVVTIHQSIIEL